METDSREVMESAGGRIPGTNSPAFTLTMPDDAPIPILIAAPHAGREYPEPVLQRMRDAEYSALRLEDRHVDDLATRVALETGAGLLVAHAPRAMLDLNRAGDDIDWAMIAQGGPQERRNSLLNRRSRSGLGLVPRRLGGLGEIWSSRLSYSELKERVETIHHPYHLALGRALESLRDRWGAAVLLDFHSMPPLRPRFPEDMPAEFVIGDRFGASCDDALVAGAFAYFASHERRAAHNRPYAGGYILDRHAAPARGIHGIQLEICRSLYLDARLAEPSARLPSVAKLLIGLIREMGDIAMGIARGGTLPLAAE